MILNQSTFMKLNIRVDKQIYKNPKGLILYLYMSGKDGSIYVPEDITFKLKEEGESYSNKQELVIKDDEIQILLDDLYHYGYRPSDEIKKDDLINTLQKEISKRDEMIQKLMDQFVFKDAELQFKRKVTT